jgi:hypothetical protein
MKNLTTYTLLTLSAFLFSFTKGDYEKVMKATIETMHKAESLQDIQQVANRFARIGAAEKKQWLPTYYQAYCYIMMTTREQDVTNWDGFLDKADALLEEIHKMKKADRVETLALKGFSAMMRINVDPATRGQEYSMKSAGYLQQAHQLNEENPRVNLMMAQMLYGTAQFFGSSTDEACAKFNHSVELFAKEELEGRGIQPSWGKPQAALMLSKCGTATQDN